MKATKEQIQATFDQLARVEAALTDIQPVEYKLPRGIVDYFNTDPYYQLLEERTRILGELQDLGEDLTNLYPADILQHAKVRRHPELAESTIPTTYRRSKGIE